MRDTVKNLTELRNLLSELKEYELDRLVANLEESTQFGLGVIKGAIGAYAEIDDILRDSLKYQEGVE